MAIEHIKIPVICLEGIKMLKDAERGRLFLAMLEYREGRELSLDGGEQYLFSVLKAQMDRDNEIGAARVKSGRSGGVAKASKAKQSMANASTPPPPPSPPTPPVSLSPTPKEKPPKGGKEKRVFEPPTVEAVRAYCAEKGYRVDPDGFVDHYAARGWRYNGNIPMSDWKAAVRTWERRGKETNGIESKTEYFRAPAL